MDWQASELCCIAAVAIAVLATGCSTLQPTPAAQHITPKMLIEARPLIGDRELSPVPDTDILALDQDMLAFLDRFVAAKRSDPIKLHQLLTAIMSDNSFKLEYDSTTRTAIETFHDRHGNCLSFTNMFVAMARHLGIDARYQEVDIPPNWAVQSGSFVFNGHINVLINLGVFGKRVVDFNIDDFQAEFGQKQVRDRRARAHYYNNIGAEHLLDGAADEALRYFRKSIETDIHFGPPWTNLGSLYRRNGDIHYAEAAYLRAIVSTLGRSVAMSNLAALYEAMGETKRATLYQGRVNAHRLRNPYYRYRLGQRAFDSGDYKGAIKHLRSAVRSERNEHRFYFLLGLSYLNLGDTKAARRWMTEAVDVSPNDELKREYESKIEKLLSAGPADGNASLQTELTPVTDVS